MKKIIFTLLALIITYTVIAQIVVSKEGGWHKIGSKNVAFKTDQDEIMVIGNDIFKSIRLKIEEAPVHIASLQVHYEDGTMEDIPVKGNIEKGKTTKTYNLKKENMGLKKVVFIYHTISSSDDERAKVELWGLK